MIRSQLDPMPEYFDRYINLCDDITIQEAIQTSIDELDHLPLQQLEMLDNQAYAPGKWTVKDILQHLIDTERIFAYRALAFARGEVQDMPLYAEDDYAQTAMASDRIMGSLIEELRISHLSLKTLFASFTPDMLRKRGKGFKGMYTVASVGFILPGHQRWHFRVLKEKYLPLLS